MNLTTETLVVFLLLMPGFLSSAVLNALVVRRAKDRAGNIIEALVFSFLIYAILAPFGRSPVERAHSRFPGHALTPTGVMAIRCKQFHLPDL